jgi:hypothetical protein
MKSQSTEPIYKLERSLHYSYSIQEEIVDLYIGSQRISTVGHDIAEVIDINWVSIFIIILNNSLPIAHQVGHKSGNILWSFDALTSVEEFLKKAK